MEKNTLAPAELSQQASQHLLQDLRAAVADLKTVNAWFGLSRFVVLGSVTLCMAGLAWSTHAWGLFLLGAVVTGLSYSFLLICNHDATHNTLTGWQWFDTLVSRLISWPMLLPIGTYDSLHHLHHGRNGFDLSDPERVQWTVAEYEAMSPWQRWYVRHQWMIDIFVLGSVGLVLKTLVHAFKLQGHFPKLRQQIVIDALGMLSTQAIVLAFVVLQSVSLWKYLLFWFVLERGIGVVLQTRDHIEHYGLWHPMGNYQLTQLYSCRNIKTYAWVNWLMGGLPYHSVHHAFPDIASNRLPEAFDRIQTVLQRYHLPSMPLSAGYVKTSLRLRKYQLISL